VFGFVFRHCGEPTEQEHSEHEPDHGTEYETGYEVHHRTSRVGQRGIDATGERADVVAQHSVDAVDNDRDGGQDERLFRHRLTTQLTNR
jgi:hypothetical protein